MNINQAVIMLVETESSTDRCKRDIEALKEERVRLDELIVKYKQLIKLYKEE